MNILKTLEFPSVQSEDDSRPLEVLILERSKALQVKKMFVLEDQNQESKKMFYRAVLFARGRPRRMKRIICKKNSYLTVLFSKHKIHVNDQL